MPRVLNVLRKASHTETPHARFHPRRSLLRPGQASVHYAQASSYLIEFYADYQSSSLPVRQTSLIFNLKLMKNMYRVQSLNTVWPLITGRKFLLEYHNLAQIMDTEQTISTQVTLVSNHSSCLPHFCTHRNDMKQTEQYISINTYSNNNCKNSDISCEFSLFREVAGIHYYYYY